MKPPWPRTSTPSAVFAVGMAKPAARAGDGFPRLRLVSVVLDGDEALPPISGGRIFVGVEIEADNSPRGPARDHTHLPAAGELASVPVPFLVDGLGDRLGCELRPRR